MLHSLSDQEQSVRQWEEQMSLNFTQEAICKSQETIRKFAVGNSGERLQEGRGKGVGPSHC